jgi:hypothetical protein
MIKILFIGDIFAKPGRRVVRALLPKIIEENEIDLTIANGENLAGGLGITPKTAQEMFDTGIDILTTGNHLWDKKEIIEYLPEEPRILRPANYPPKVPGNCLFLYEIKNKGKVAIFNLMGRTFTLPIDCPFRTADQYISKIHELDDIKIIVVDFHAEATAEKMALAWYLDGRVSAVIGTHTHIQTADERILPKGTSYITDAGMTGSHDSVIGIRPQDAINRFLLQIPSRFQPAKKNPVLNSLIITVDENSGKSLDIQRLIIKIELN